MTNQTHHFILERWRPACGLLLWGVAVIAVLEIRNLPVDFGHGICGPWGCGPPLQVLVACHAFWLVNLTAVSCALAARVSATWLARLANGAIIAGLAGLIGLAIWQEVCWAPQVSEWVRPYMVQRYLFSLATLVDVPIAEVLLFGIIFRCLQRRNRRLPEIPNSQLSVFSTED